MWIGAQARIRHHSQESLLCRSLAGDMPETKWPITVNETALRRFRRFQGRDRVAVHDQIAPPRPGAPLPTHTPSPSRIFTTHACPELTFHNPATAAPDRPQTHAFIMGNHDFGCAAFLGVLPGSVLPGRDTDYTPWRAEQPLWAGAGSEARDFRF